MHSIKTTLLGIVTATSVLAPIADAEAWVAAARGWGGRGAVAVGGYHGAYYHGGGCWGCGAAAGAVAGLAVGASGRECGAPCNGGRSTTGVLPAGLPVLPAG